MNIGIIIHSHTGHTLSVGERLKDALLAGGHTVQLERVTAENEVPNSKEAVRLKSIPDITPYDTVIIGAPVRGFSMSPVMKAYLSQIPDIGGKKAACFVTEYFPRPWMGGNRAIGQMVLDISQKGGKVIDTGVVNWTSKARESQISNIVSRMCGGGLVHEKVL